MIEIGAVMEDKVAEGRVVEVELAKCTGHGICESIAPDAFEVQDDGTVVIDHEHAAKLARSTLTQAVTQCPAAALRLVD
jgi:ferredoxin